MVAMLAPGQYIVHITTLIHGQKALEGHSYTMINPNPVELARMLPRWPKDTGVLHIFTATVSRDAALHYALQQPLH